MLDKQLIEDHIAKFSDLLKELGNKHLNHYVYVYRDPRDNKIFYVGEGIDGRVLDHLRDTLVAENPKRTEAHTAKTRRIVEIWSADEMVEWQIISRKHKTQKDAEIAEAAVMTALGISQNGQLLNLQGGKHGTEHGSIPMEELEALGAQPVNPADSCDTVFLFSIHDSLEKGLSPYEGTRSSWRVAERWRNRTDAIAVGLDQGRSVGAFRIDDWEKAGDGRWRFSGTELQNDLHNKRWTHVINAARGYFQRGNFLVVDFDGNGRFRVLRGSSAQEWQSLN